MSRLQALSAMKAVDSAPRVGAGTLGAPQKTREQGVNVEAQAGAKRAAEVWPKGRSAQLLRASLLCEPLPLSTPLLCALLSQVPLQLPLPL